MASQQQQQVPPPPPYSNVTPQQEETCRQALSTACQILEEARGQEAQLEALQVWNASLLQHQQQHLVDIEKKPQAIQQAWTSLATQVNNTSSSTEQQELPSATTVNHNKPVTLRGGQWSKAVQTQVMGRSLKRTAELASHIHTNRSVQGPTLQTALQSATTTTKDPNVWLRIMDERLSQIQTYHAKLDNKRIKVDDYDLVSSSFQIDNLFSLEEVMGKYLDLQTLYQEFHDCHYLFDTKSYADFLQVLANGLHLLPESTKLANRKKYVRFLSQLQDYLENFVQRTSPLVALHDITNVALQAFETTWSQTGGCAGWQAKPAEAALCQKNDETKQQSSIDLVPYNTPEQLLEAFNGDQLKTELARLGLKCGGTPADRAKRLFLTKDTPLDQLPAKAKKDTTTSAVKQRVDIARREVVIGALLDQLRPTLEATIRRTERRQTQTLNEREQQVEEELYGSQVPTKSESDQDDDDDDAPIYNPKNVPLDWDGKPIPYWLFKLHGLNHYYSCEICGGESYRGRRNFELHFAEQKHALGMKSLGIPNTKHFHGVTKIEDAQELWKTLQEKLQQEQFDGTREEEYEDSHGNVLSRTTYEDLARQGLL